MDSSGNLDDPHDMAEWIESLKIWIENNAPSERKMSEDSIQDEHSHNELHFDLIMYASNIHCFPKSAHVTHLQGQKILILYSN